MFKAFSAQENYDSFCLAYTFTHRDFNDGTLGLAYTAEVDLAGGMCTKNAVSLLSYNIEIIKCIRQRIVNPKVITNFNM